MSEKTALITGVTGQTGSYLAELLLAKHYAVAGLKRRHAAYNPRNLATCFNYPETFTLIDGDMTDESSLRAIIEAVQPDEIYNMAAMSFVAQSWNTPISTNDVNYLGFIKLLEAVRAIKPNTKVYQASSSEMFGNQPPPQHEMTRMTPRSPYGVSKLAAHRVAQVYRESFGMFISCGICFNHESPRRGIDFVTRKIAVGLAARAIYAGNPKIKLGYLDSKRDWGYAPDYARAMWMMLQRGAADDWVIATGETHSVREYLQLAFEASGLSGQVEDHVEIDESLYRPAEVFELRGDPSRANKILEWEPEVNFKQLVEIMVTSELKLQTPL
jgi:GDPmannose 4,6-dehydratase